jgi:hypothetical protein
MTDAMPQGVTAGLLDEGPGVRAAELADLDGPQERRLEIPEVHPVLGARFGVEGLPVDRDAFQSGSLFRAVLLMGMCQACDA